MTVLNLGELLSFPGEIREQIWLHLRPQNDRVRSSMSILRACRQLHNEVGFYIYDKEILTFHLSPTYPEDPWFRVTNSLGARWKISSLSEAKRLGFADLPYHKLKGIKIKIGAPDSRDPGQLICLGMKLRELVSLLKGRELPEINIYLRDTATTSWMDANGRTQRSIPAELSSEFIQYRYRTDYHIFVFEVTSLRSSRNAHIHYPERLQTYHKQRHQVFGPKPFSPTTAENKRILDAMFLELEIVLDRIPGTTTDMLRLRRFASW